MKFGLLGPLSIGDGAQVHAIGPAKQRTVLAILLIDARRPVPTDRMIETIWGGLPPRSAEATLRNYVLRLRRRIGAAGPRIVTTAGGYMFEAEDEEIDLRRFDRLCKHAEAALAAGNAELAADLLGQALALWRGPALSDVPCETLRREVRPALEEQRLHVSELKLAAECALGRSGAVIPELLRLTAAHPWRERLWGQLMVAYFRSGRQAEALAVYRKVQRILANELGLRPGSELAELHQRILSGDMYYIPGPWNLVS